MSLQLRGIRKHYGAHAVLRALDLDVEPAEVYGLIGQNGSGKSTALHVAAGLLRPDGGQVLHGGSVISSATRARLGFTPQHPALYPRLTCEETLRFFGQVYGVPRARRRERVEAVIQATGLEPYRNARTQALSGGWRQRLSLAVSLVHEPRLLVLDEPTTGLDVRVQREVWELIASMADGGAAVILASHDLVETDDHCHRVGILNQGRIVAEGSPDELRRRIPATDIAEVGVEDARGLLDRSRERGWTVRSRGERWLLWLRTPTTLPELARTLSGLALRSLALRPVTLEDVFVELTGRGDPELDPVGEAEAGWRVSR